MIARGTKSSDPSRRYWTSGIHRCRALSTGLWSSSEGIGDGVQRMLMGRVDPRLRTPEELRAEFESEWSGVLEKRRGTKVRTRVDGMRCQA